MARDPHDEAPRWVQLSIQALIVYSIITTCLETMPELAAYGNFFSVSEMVVVAAFTCEYLVFWLISRQGLRYPLQPMALVDLLAILPFYLQLGIDLRALRALRLLRIYRVLRIGRYSHALRTLGEALRRCAPELLSIGFIAAIVILISAMGLYYAEHDAQPEVYTSIPDSLWWSVVTLTTVGYGDVYPVTTAGRIIAASVMLLGIAFIALPAGILSSTMTEMLRERRKAS